MRNLTPKKIATIAFTSLMIVAGVLTIVGFALDWWSLVFGSDETMADEPAFVAQPQPEAQSVPKTPTPFPTATVVTTAQSMLKSAKSIPSASQRDKGLQTVATTAVAGFDYDTAIEAGRATPGSTAKGSTLAFVARCAAQDSLFDKADEAARYIPSIGSNQ